MSGAHSGLQEAGSIDGLHNIVNSTCSRGYHGALELSRLQITRKRQQTLIKK